MSITWNTATEEKTTSKDITPKNNYCTYNSLKMKGYKDAFQWDRMYRDINLTITSSTMRFINCSANIPPLRMETNYFPKVLPDL